MGVFREQNKDRTALYLKPCLEGDCSLGRKTLWEGSQRCPLEKDEERGSSKKIE